MLCWRIGQFLREVKLLWYLTSFNYSRSPNASWDHLQKSRTASFLAESPDPPCEHNVWPRAKLSRLFGKSTKLWRNISPKVKLCRLLGQFTFSSFWLKLWPSVMIWRLLGKVTSCRHCLKSWPKVKLSRPIWPEEIWIIIPYVVFSMIFGLFIVKLHNWLVGMHFSCLQSRWSGTVRDLVADKRHDFQFCFKTRHTCSNAIPGKVQRFVERR